MKLPQKLAKPPLVEAIFEMRFKSKAIVSSILPGLLFTKLSGAKSIERLPAAEFPQQLRNADPALQYAPLVRVGWDRFVILIGDRNLALACKHPYPGWKEFKPAIVHLVELVKEANIVDDVERMSLKNTNILPSEMGTVADLIKFDLIVGAHHAANDNLLIRVEILQDDLLHIVQIATSGTAKFPDGTARSGAMLDIDTIAIAADTPLAKLAERLAERIDVIHAGNKFMFFDCLKPETVHKLEPSYD
jgi:uncharacterized protein (TIGR04255 family)